MEEVVIVRSPKGGYLFDVHHVKWADGEPKLIKTLDTEVTFDYAVDLREHHMMKLDIRDTPYETKDEEALCD